MSTNHTGKKTAAVTGATGSIGQAIASSLANQDYRVILLIRNPEKAKQTLNDIRLSSGNTDIDYKIVDLSIQSSVQSLADSWEGPLDVLVNNAAISPRDRMETPQGIELQFATNVLGYFWMIYFFSDILSNSAPSRVVNVASYWAGGLRLDDLEFKKRPYHNHDAYRQSKQANRMLSAYFASQFDPTSITVNSCHPGDVNSSLSNSLGFGGSQSPSEGARTPVWLASSPEVSGITGQYFERMKATQCPYSSDLEKAEVLYRACLAYTE
jgi:retinol dehydrogenase-13